MEIGTIIEYFSLKGPKIETRTTSRPFVNAHGEKVILILGHRDPVSFDRVIESPRFRAAKRFYNPELQSIRNMENQAT